MLQETDDIQRMRARLRRIRAARADRWHAVRCTVHTEFRVRSALDKLEVATVLPTVERWHKRPGKAHKVKRDMPLYAGYIFVGFTNAPNWLDVCSIEPGPVVPVGDGRNAWTLSAKDLAYLRALEDGETAPADTLKAGSTARIGEGHWAQGQSGTIQALKCDIAQISIAFLGSLRPINLHISLLSAA